MSTRSKGLTSKQEQVHNWLGEGMHPNEIAKRMGVTPSAVYAHMRNIRQAGVTLPSEQLSPELPPATPEPTSEPVSAEDGTTDPEAGLLAALNARKLRVQEIDREVEGLRARQEALAEERGQIEKQYQAALGALT